MATDNRALDYATKGATRSLLSSIDEMASQADKLLEGETIVELDPATIDDSFCQRSLLTSMTMTIGKSSSGCWKRCASEDKIPQCSLVRIRARLAAICSSLAT
ncbi:hypothetical protein N8D56_25850 (plasmid) [Devosia sp. A8/3-2]|nr:hypothetical protein N8D56_25850 [Devosia sp. A8/3-2]